MRTRLASFFCIDLPCVLSLVGLWARFIEPRLLCVTSLKWQVASSHRHLDGLTIVHLSDLHFHASFSDAFLERIVRKVRRLKPDLLVFTGDFICYARLEEQARLKSFLGQLSAPLGAYCVFGNHDYGEYVSRNREGNYAKMTPPPPFKGVVRGLQTLFGALPAGNEVTQEVLGVGLHADLTALLRETPFTLLENLSVTLPVGLNIVGLGEYILGRSRPEVAFSSYDRRFPGLILTHNPDSLPRLLPFPGDLVLAGHTHGQQIHLPFLRHLSEKLTRLEQPHLSRGRHVVGDKELIVNRGLGGHKPLRFCSPPEIGCIKITAHDD